MSSNGLSKNSLKDGYEVTLSYLSYDGQSDKLSFPMKVRERHLTPGPTTCQVQAIGLELQIAIWSERDNIAIRIPLTCWMASKPYQQKLCGANNGLLSVGRFDSAIATEETSEGTAVRGTLWTHDSNNPM